MDWSHLPYDVLGAVLRATGSGAQVARAAAVSTSWRAAAGQRELWSDLAAQCLGVKPHRLEAGGHPKDAFVEALTSEAWCWGLLPHGGPCPLPGGDTCAASLMAHTTSGSRCAAPARLTAAPPPAAAAAAAADAAAALAPPRGGAAPGAPEEQAAAAGGAAPPCVAAAAADTAAAAAAAARVAAPAAVAAGEDFVVVLGAGGRLWDSRAAAKHRHPGVKLSDAGAALRGVVVTAIAAGQYHALALSASGEVYGWGACGAGQLGLGGRRAWVAAPEELTGGLRAAWEAAGEPDRVVAIAAGAEHSGLLTARGRVYLAGLNCSGQCGRAPRGAAGGGGGGAACVEAWAEAEAPRGAGRAAQLALGWRNTVVVTSLGRVLVCGDNSHGQCTPGAPAPPPPPGAPAAHGTAAAARPALTDAGPGAAWHGVARRGQAAEGGGGEAADTVIAAAAGRGVIYALTQRGDVFQWGAPPCGGGGGGGGARGAAAPARVPGVRGAVSIAVPAAGRFAAAVDGAGRLFTWGAGKAGQLGLGSTSKASTAREVKALRGMRVLAVACGTDHAAAVTAWRAPRRGCGGLSRTTSGVSTASNGGGGGGSGGGGDDDGGDGPGGAPPGGQEPQGGGGGAGGGGGGGGARRPPPPAPGGGGAGGGGMRVYMSAHVRDGAPRAAAALETGGGAAGGRGGDTAGGREAGGDCRGGARDQGVRRERGAWRRRGRGGGSGDEAAARAAPQERGVAFAVRRLLKQFVNDPRMREITLPEALTPADRFRLHVVCEEWGLGHESRGEGAARALAVWKPSRGRGRGGGGGEGGGGEGGGGEDVTEEGGAGEESAPAAAPGSGGGGVFVEVA
ncbi:MAG: hypothetical protein J3K34DRAFT_526763 [Monoraphidium minutum]|nr:MAG: hypothetical protein J3K34DRAFT_526763 [Monoraphidium minutum]